MSRGRNINEQVEIDVTDGLNLIFQIDRNMIKSFDTSMINWDRFQIISNNHQKRQKLKKETQYINQYDCHQQLIGSRFN
ncbi:hypothetical protein DERP_001311 [Dermatophagoides pteronyssinus]|uniref:Uncharacterized protein n=1 Tax=Dermatophagoides pteronyssinus TaxID=6956 RepID=A0ABQ8JE36_DERPT|nr:hypothetical protein DERP_001311 [Dermatophagoides pteronyssinus]